MPEEQIVRCHLWIRGVVQGVGFRYFADRTARRLGLSGFVRNLPDGRVEAAAEGARPLVDEFMAQMRRGPSGALIQDLFVEWEAPAGHAGFRISG